jgi:hypothetical protein
MKMIAKTIIAASILGTAIALTAPASAGVRIGISFGWFGAGVAPFADPCDYYDYYDEAPPWGLPPDYCDYPVYFGSIFWGGTWYRGPIYYRWDGGRRLYWLNGNWHADGWQGGRVPYVQWNDRGIHDRGHNWDGGRGMRRSFDRDGDTFSFRSNRDNGSVGEAPRHGRDAKRVERGPDRNGKQDGHGGNGPVGRGHDDGGHRGSGQNEGGHSSGGHGR